MANQDFLPVPINRKLLSRIMGNIAVSTKHFYNNTPCWDWTGYLRQDGYGGSSWDCRPIVTHRLTYRMFVGAIPTGMHIDHLCRRRNCCNPCHLEAVTPRVNALRGVGAAAVNALKTHCKNGHELTGNNVILYGKNNRQRQCRICRDNNNRNRISPNYRRFLELSKDSVEQIRSLHVNEHISVKALAKQFGTSPIRIKQLIGEGLVKSFPNKDKTHCPQGHEFTPENTYLFVNEEGIRRRCKTCNQERCKKRYHRVKEQEEVA